MKKCLLLFLIFLSSSSFACECSQLVPISMDLCQNYDVVFYGRIDSVSICDNKSERAIAYFTIEELYKGEVKKHVKINFDCSSECMMSFAGEEEWIIYAKYTKFDHLVVSICEHSRKKFAKGVEDLYFLDSKRTFDEELKFLKSTLGIQATTEPIVINNAETGTGRHNTQPTGWGKVILLLVSLVVMIVVYILTRKKK